MAVLAVKGLIVHYGRRVAVDGLDLVLEPGEIVGLLGPNGAGKSTALMAIAGGVMPSAGTIVVGGADLAKDPLGAKAKVGFADQPPSLYEFFTVAEHVAFVAEEFVITIDNVRPHPVRVLIREHLYRGLNWTLAYISVPVGDDTKEGPQQVAPRITVPPHSKGRVLYAVVYWW